MQTETSLTVTLHPCERIYHAGASGKIFGDVPGICRITGKPSKGLPFNKWVRDTFTDHGSLKPGSIISNEALFCFEEASEIVMKRAGKEKASLEILEGQDLELFESFQFAPGSNGSDQYSYLSL